MIIRTSKEEVALYRASTAVSQSKLKLLTVSAQAFQEVKEPEMFFEEKEHFLIGSAVDDYITMGAEYFQETYYVSQRSKPSDVIMSIIQQVFATRVSDSIFDNDLLPAIESHNYQPNWKPDTKIAKISIEGESYWSELLQSEGKTVISIEQQLIINKVLNDLFNNRFTERYFRDSKNTTTYYQLPIYFEFDGVQCKALLDMVIVDHENQSIMPIDIKTMSGYTKEFDYQSYKRRYDIQAGWYMEAIFSWVLQNYPTYSVNLFRFIVASSNKPCDSLMFETTVDFLNAGKHGVIKLNSYQINSVNEEIKEAEHYTEGYSQLITKYKWHEENGWTYDYESEIKLGHFLIGGDYRRQ